LFASVAAASDWPVWRGPKGDGVVVDPSIPLKWSASQNVAWKVPVSGIGHSSPVICAGRVFLTAFDPATKERLLLCYDRKDGTLLWRAAVLTAEAESMHENNSPASATPAADDSHIWVTFQSGSTIVAACYDISGKQIWSNSFAGFASPHGFCGTPVLFEDLVIVNGDSDGEAFVAGLDKITGVTRWKTPRPKRTRSFSTPLFIEVGNAPQMVLAGSKSITSLDPRTGKPIWIVDSPTDKFVATVAYTDGVLFATGTSPNHTLTGIDPTGVGNVTKSHVLWTNSKGAAYVPSPIGFGKQFFTITDAGFVSLTEARTGDKLWYERLGSGVVFASPLLINGLIYCLAGDGTMFILKWGHKFELVATNKLDEECHATPAVSNGQLFVRSANHLWCIGR
jgi:outer membrane protein assembly factor BamB